jgi:hypothetical protein
MKSLSDIPFDQRADIYKALDFLLEKLGMPPIEAKPYDELTRVELGVNNTGVTFSMSIYFEESSPINDKKILKMFGEDN